jgi:hypothetical protein
VILNKVNGLAKINIERRSEFFNGTKSNPPVTWPGGSLVKKESSKLQKKNNMDYAESQYVFDFSVKGG